MRYWEYTICACDGDEVVLVEYEDGTREYLCDGYAFRDEESAVRWFYKVHDIVPYEAREYPIPDEEPAVIIVASSDATEEFVRQIVL